MPSQTVSFSGSFVALITPFTSKGRIDRKALAALVEWHIQQGTDGLVCCGTTGESCTLSRSEKKSVVETCVQVSHGRIPIIAGAGTPDTAESARLIADALRAGADGALVVTPFYVKPTQRGCLEHYRELAQVGLPIIAYHNPGRALFRFEWETIHQLGEIEGIVGFKDSSGSLDFVKTFRKVTRLPLFSGDDDLTYQTILEGGVGAISVIGNLIPKGWKRMIQLAKLGDPLGAVLARDYLPLCKANFIETNPQCIKFLASQVELCKPYWRLPLLPPTIETQEKLKRVLLRMSLPQYKEIKSQLTES